MFVVLHSLNSVILKFQFCLSCLRNVFFSISITEQNAYTHIHICCHHSNLNNFQNTFITFI